MSNDELKQQGTQQQQQQQQRARGPPLFFFCATFFLESLLVWTLTVSLQFHLHKQLNRFYRRVLAWWYHAHGFWVATHHWQTHGNDSRSCVGALANHYLHCWKETNTCCSGNTNKQTNVCPIDTPCGRRNQCLKRSTTYWYHAPESNCPGVVPARCRPPPRR